MPKTKLKMYSLFNSPIELKTKAIKRTKGFKLLGLNILEKKKTKFLMEVSNDSKT